MSVIARRRNGVLTVHNLGSETITQVRAIGVGVLALTLEPRGVARRSGCEAVQHVLYGDSSGSSNRIGVTDEG